MRAEQAHSWAEWAEGSATLLKRDLLELQARVTELENALARVGVERTPVSNGGVVVPMHNRGIAVP